MLGNRLRRWPNISLDQQYAWCFLGVAFQSMNTLESRPYSVHFLPPPPPPRRTLTPMVDPYRRRRFKT